MFLGYNVSSINNKITWRILRSTCGADLLMPVETLQEEKGSKCRSKSWKAAQVNGMCTGFSNRPPPPALTLGPRTNPLL